VGAVAADSAGDSEVPIRPQLTFKGDQIVFDFAGTSAQVAGNFNCPLNATLPAVCCTLKALIDNELPSNKGMIDSVTVKDFTRSTTFDLKLWGGRLRAAKFAPAHCDGTGLAKWRILLSLHGQLLWAGRNQC
jgi:hypothetical protein